MVTAIRATVMLAVLVGLPAAWVYYGPLPDHAQPGHPSAQHVAAVPEPSVIGLLLLGAAALALSRRRTTVRRA